MFAKEELSWWRIGAHVAAFGIAAGLGAIVLHPLCPIFEHDTDTPADARDAYLMAVFIIASIGPGIMAAIFALLKTMRRVRGR